MGTGPALTLTNLHVDLVALAVFSGEERVGQVVADDFSFGGVPVEFSVQPHGDVGEVADFQHAVMGPDVGNRLLARLHAFDEVGGENGDTARC